MSFKRNIFLRRKKKEVTFKLLTGVIVPSSGSLSAKLLYINCGKIHVSLIISFFENCLWQICIHWPSIAHRVFCCVGLLPFWRLVMKFKV